MRGIVKGEADDSLFSVLTKTSQTTEALTKAISLMLCVP